MDKHKQCHKCQAAAEDDLVLLWDGYEYCSSCIEAAQPGLADYARTHPVLLEEMSDRFKSKLPTFWTVYFHFLKMRWRWSLFIIIGFLVLISLSFSGTGFYLVLLIIPFDLVSTFIGVYFFNRFYARPGDGNVSLSITEGIVKIRRGAKVNLFPLQFSNWANFNDSNLTELPFGSIFQSETCLMASENRVRAVFKSAITICDFDEESLARWLAFLKLAGISVHHSR